MWVRLVMGSQEQVIVASRDGKQSSLPRQVPVSLQLVVRLEGEPAHPRPGIVDTPSGDGLSQVNLIQPPTPAFNHILHTE